MQDSINGAYGSFRRVSHATSLTSATAISGGQLYTAIAMFLFDDPTRCWENGVLLVDVSGSV